jgi:FkbM family methyltransferase
MSRIFVDIGAHYGETLSVALDPKWGFTQVVSVEPSARCLPLLKSFRDPRLSVHQVALSNRDDTAILHGAGLLGGSLYADKAQLTDQVDTESVTLVRASNWFKQNIPAGAEVFLKMNCEGGEADILDDLLDSGEIARVRSMYVDFDIRKVPSQAHRQAELERRLSEAGVRWTQVDRRNFGANEGVTQWLSKECPVVSASASALIRHRLHSYAPPYVRATMLARNLMPKQLYWWLGRRFGRNARKNNAAI